SVIVPLPEELSTATASMGLLAVISKTLPLTVTKGYFFSCAVSTRDAVTKQKTKSKCLFNRKF
ncbi:hypothetical protein ACSTJG_24975, partial [Vibrio parahaemolyticus]